jgi:hypothetical protein
VFFTFGEKEEEENPGGGKIILKNNSVMVHSKTQEPFSFFTSYILMYNNMYVCSRCVVFVI